MASIGTCGFVNCCGASICRTLNLVIMEKTPMEKPNKLIISYCPTASHDSTSGGVFQCFEDSLPVIIVKQRERVPDSGYQATKAVRGFWVAIPECLLNLEDRNE